MTMMDVAERYAEEAWQAFLAELPPELRDDALRSGATKVAALDGFHRGFLKASELLLPAVRR